MDNHGDLTPEDKALLRREQQHRIQQQREREADPFYRLRRWVKAKPMMWKAGYLITIVSLCLALPLLQMLSAPLIGADSMFRAMGIVLASGVVIGVGLMLTNWR